MFLISKLSIFFRRQIFNKIESNFLKQTLVQIFLAKLSEFFKHNFFMQKGVNFSKSTESQIFLCRTEPNVSLQNWVQFFQAKLRQQH